MLQVCICAADKVTVKSDAVQYRRPEFYSSVSQCVCADNSTFDVVLSKSIQSFVKAGIFLSSHHI